MQATQKVQKNRIKGATFQLQKLDYMIFNHLLSTWVSKIKSIFYWFSFLLDVNNSKSSKKLKKKEFDSRKAIKVLTNGLD